MSSGLTAGQSVSVYPRRQLQALVRPHATAGVTQRSGSNNHLSPGNTEDVLVNAGQSPVDDGFEHRHNVATAFSEAVLDAGWHLCELLAVDESVPVKLLELSA